MDKKQPTNMHHEVRETHWGTNDTAIMTLQHPNPQAQFAMRLMEHFGIVTARPAGEDSAGRQKLELLPPQEVVSRAVSIAELGWETFERNGWILTVPPTPKPSTEA